MILELIKTVGILALVLGIIFALAYAAKRFGLGRATEKGGESGWRILSVKSLGPRRQVFIVEVGSRILLVGVTDKMMTPLMEVTNLEERNAIVASIEKTAAKGNVFAQYLKRAEA